MQNLGRLVFVIVLATAAMCSYADRALGEPNARRTFELAIRRGLVLIQGAGPGVGFVVRSTHDMSWIATANHVVTFDVPDPSVRVLRVGDLPYGFTVQASPVPVTPIFPLPGTNPTQDLALFSIRVGHLPELCMSLNMPGTSDEVALGTFAPLYLMPGFLDETASAARSAAAVSINGNGALFSADPKTGLAYFQAASEVANSGSPLFAVKTGLVVGVLSDAVDNTLQARQAEASGKLARSVSTNPEAGFSPLNRKGPSRDAMEHAFRSALPGLPYVSTTGASVSSRITSRRRVFPDMDTAQKILLIEVQRAGPSFDQVYRLNQGSFLSALQIAIADSIPVSKMFDSLEPRLRDMGDVVSGECDAAQAAAAVVLKIDVIPPARSGDGRRHLITSPSLWDCIGFPIEEGAARDEITDGNGFVASLPTRLAATISEIAGGLRQRPPSPTPSAGYAELGTQRLRTFGYSSLLLADTERRSFARVFASDGRIMITPSWIKGTLSQRFHKANLDGPLRLVSVNGAPVAASADPFALERRIDTPEKDEIDVVVSTKAGPPVALHVPAWGRCDYLRARAGEYYNGVLKTANGPYYDYSFPKAGAHR